MEVTDNGLENLVNNALVVESDLAEVKTSVKPVDELLDTNLTSIALSCQEFRNALSSIALFANIVRNAIESFGKDVVPLVDLAESETSLEDLVEAVTMEAEKIARIANEGSGAIDAKFGGIKRQVEGLAREVEDAEKDLASEAEIHFQKLTAQVNVYNPAAKPQGSRLSQVTETAGELVGSFVLFGRGTKKDNEDTKTITAATPKLDATKTKTDEASISESAIAYSYLPTDKPSKAISLDVIHKFFQQEAQREADEEEYLAKQQELVELKRDIAARLTTIKNAKT
ncbi:hypothetical protein M422DRAFT_274807 [Sphaerobolus stellatus SS14]|uniref:Uncharacterized protein n=1 Tax=Sphaerobolus stellatus (strain SS14) TaxID=990650 RepID=A0A0C9UG73_SPHS4|nr:hypothetical protein M422DRAFT_274807 [Sphaerobolus stellatus SS14]